MADQKKWYSFFPNLLTSMNLICGSLAIYFVFIGTVKMAVVLMFAAAVFDFFDGFAARLLKVSGPLGKELDSLSDLVSFGLLPGFFVLYLESHLLFDCEIFEISSFSIIEALLCLVSLMIPVFSALRLAKFNLDTRQTDHFIGLPTPANAIFFASITWSFFENGSWGSISHSICAVVLSVITILFSLLLVSELPMIALKFKNYKFKGNEFRYLVIFAFVAMIFLKGISGLWIAFLCYVFISVMQNIISKASPRDSK